MTRNNKYRILPPLSDEEFAVLKNDIAARGVLIPIEVDEYGQVLDGFHRERACAELGIKSVPFIVRRGLCEALKIDHIASVNIVKRHLDKHQLKTLAANLRAKGLTQERIRRILGVTQRTISNWLKEEFRNFSEPTTVTGKDGKSYPAKKTVRVERGQKRTRILSIGPERIAEIRKQLQYVWARLAHLIIQGVGQLLAWVGRQQRS